MGFSTFVTVKRGASGSVVASHVPLRFDNISPQVAAQMGGASPFNSYEVYSLVGVPDVENADQLLDEVNADPKTGGQVLYRVNGNPETWDGSYLSCLVERLVGKVPA